MMRKSKGRRRSMRSFSPSRREIARHVLVELKRRLFRDPRRSRGNRAVRRFFTGRRKRR